MAEVTAITDKDKSTKNLQIVVFKLGSEFYGIHIDQIKEVVLTPSITRMPETAAYLRGVANIRGNVTAILDLEDRFNIAKAHSDHPGKYTLVVESKDVRMGLLVNEVPVTTSVKNAEFDESAGILAGEEGDSNYIRGIIKSGDRLIILIDIFKAIDQSVINRIRRI